uniref:ribonuclease H n=1 Tax=Latimeria chalumnae TaxID=7897 RepID=H3A008_LATCH
RRLNAVTPPMAPIVADLSLLTTTLHPTYSIFTVLDIANGFWSLPHHPDCQYKFAFAFQGTQYTWTCLPQGFHNSPALFHAAMRDALIPFPYRDNLVQYVDDLLLASSSKEEHLLHLEALLETISKAGLKVNPDKAQIAKDCVSFLGIAITPSGRALDRHKLKVLLALPLPTDLTSLCSFLGMCNFMRSFMWNFSALCKPLYQLLKLQQPFLWTESHTAAVMSLKTALTSAPTLSSPDYTLPFHLFFTSTITSLAAVMAQHTDAWHPLAFASRLTSSVEQKYTPCELTLLAVHWALQHFLYLTGTHEVIIHTTHSTSPSTISSPRLSCMLLSLQHRCIQVSPLLPLLSFLPAALLAFPFPPHTCPLPPPVPPPLALPFPSPPPPSGLHPSFCTLYIDGSCFHKEGTVYTGFAIYDPVSNHSELFKCEMHSAQYAELAALIQALHSFSSESLLICSDSLWTVLSATRHKNGFLSTDGKPLKHQYLLKVLFVVVYIRRGKSLSTLMLKVKAHDRSNTYNCTVDGLAKQAAVSGLLWKPPQMDLSIIDTPAVPVATVQLPDDLNTLQDMDTTIPNLVTMDPHVIVEHRLFLRKDPETGINAFIPPSDMRGLLIANPKMREQIEQYCANCLECAMINPAPRRVVGPLPIGAIKGPWHSIFMDYIDGLPRAPGGHTHLLVVVCAFTKWVEAFPMTTTTAKATAKVLLRLFSTWGIPDTVDSDRGPHFANEVMEQTLAALGVKHHLHIPYRPQASRQVERVNRTLKAGLKKMCLEQGAHWADALPWLLMALRSRVDKRTGYSPFQIMMG